MADEIKPGSTTSEFKLTMVAMGIGTILEAAAGVLHSLQDNGIAYPWFTIALAIMGTITQIAALFGYTKSRTLVKTNP